MTIKENILKVQENILKAWAASDLAAPEVVLVAVSKTKPIELIKEALAGE